MIVAELNGKLSSILDEKEDILTSNVFSFFKYTDREYLKNYLCRLGIYVSSNESKDAEFIFWPRFDDRTEPDLVIICGKYYIVIEAKLHSDFSPETEKLESQIDREIKMGKLASSNIDKEFVYIAITSEYFRNNTKYRRYESADYMFIWTNWQFLANFIFDELEYGMKTQDKLFASDLFHLLVKKKLRGFTGIGNIRIKECIVPYSEIFYNFNTSVYKGEFTGYIENLKRFNVIGLFMGFYKYSYFNSFKKYSYTEYKNIYYNG